MHKKSKFLPPGLLLALLVLGACTPTVAERGNMLDDYEMKQVTVGTSTKSDVVRVLGSPTTQAPFDPNVWYYIGDETEKKGILDPKITKEKIVVAQFDANGTLTALNVVPPGSRLDVPISQDKTPTYGNEVTLTQQFLGNLGRFNNSAAANKTDTGGGSRGQPQPGQNYP